MSYAVKELYFTLQGEGARTGRPAVFVRMTACNLWSGHEADRASAACWFCDTEFVGTDGPGGGRFESAEALADAVVGCWQRGTGGASGGAIYAVFTGGEPMLQLDEALVEACHARSVEVAIETNGTIAVPDSVDWICVSPKPSSKLVQLRGDELKLVYPQDVLPTDVEHLDFEHFYLQPLDGPERVANTEASLDYCRSHPKWHLSLQTHKLIGIP
jgi:7-carboxy-7-deazaguanine synthase (Cx14CxxC type)